MSETLHIATSPTTDEFIIQNIVIQDKKQQTNNPEQDGNKSYANHATKNASPDPRIRPPVVQKGFAKALKHLHSEFQNCFEVLDEIHSAFRDCCLLIGKMVELAEMFGETDASDEVADARAPNETITDEVKQQVEEKQIQNENVEENNEYGKERDSIDDKNDFVASEIGKPPRLSGVKKYDKRASKWTRRYPRERHDVIELIPDSKVYVNRKNLENYLINSKDSTTLALLLLDEIFTDFALKTCALVGDKAFRDAHETTRAPDLDGKAILVLLTFVWEHAKQNEWVIDKTSIFNCLGYKMLEMRKPK